MPEPTTQELPFEEEPKRLSVRREPYVSSLDLGDDFLFRQLDALKRHEKPLARFLRRQVGRPWTEVRAEIDARCRDLPVDEFIRTKVRDRLLRLVEEHPVFRSGIGWERTAGVFCGLYVNCETGLLCFQKQRPKRRRPAE
jgi:hypothetical protein